MPSFLKQLKPITSSEVNSTHNLELAPFKKGASVWVMRQAGRYLPEYRELRKEAGSFLDLCFNPQMAAEVTVQPIRRFGFDTAILFSDILVIPKALGLSVAFAEGEGPIVAKLNLDTRDSINSHLNELEAQLPNVTSELANIFETVKITKTLLQKIDSKNQLVDSLNGNNKEQNKAVNKTNEVSKTSTNLSEQSFITPLIGTPLVGFCGAPWTVALYMLEDKPSKSTEIARRFAYQHPEQFARFIDIVTEASILYLEQQIEAGVDALQIFDSWASNIPHGLFEIAVKKPLLKICKRIKAKYPDTPIILFPRGLDSNKLVEMTNIAEGHFDALGLDYSVDLTWARDNLQSKVALQGNMDPCILLTNKQTIQQEVSRILEIMQATDANNTPAEQRKGYIFNLGHGIIKETPIEHVECMLEVIKES